MQKFDYEFTRVKNDVNGNPRYVVHYLDLLSGMSVGELRRLTNV